MMCLQMSRIAWHIDQNRNMALDAGVDEEHSAHCEILMQKFEQLTQTCCFGDHLEKKYPKERRHEFAAVIDTVYTAVESSLPSGTSMDAPTHTLLKAPSSQQCMFNK